MSEIINAILRSAQLPFIGRVGGNPEVKYFPSGAVNCKFSIAVNRVKKNAEDDLPPDWFKVVMWGDLATEAGDAIKKGDLVQVTGRVSIDQWTGRDNTVNIDKVINAEKWSPVASATKPSQSQGSAPANEFGDLDDDEVLFL